MTKIDEGEAMTYWLSNFELVIVSDVEDVMVMELVINLMTRKSVFG